MTILKTQPQKIEGGYVRPRTVPFGNPMEYTDIKRRSHTDELLERNLVIVIDGSDGLEKDLCAVPVNQIIDIQKYDFIYNFTIYECKLKIFFEDWITVPDHKNPGTWFTYVPYGDTTPQNLLHEVIEHQKIDKEILKRYESC